MPTVFPGSISQAYLKGQDLQPNNGTAHIDQGLAAQVHDPLWFLSLQWLSGEFEAENGGRVGAVHVEWEEEPITRCLIEGQEHPLASGRPMESLVEKEDADGLSDAWNSESLDYSFEIRTGTAGSSQGWRLEAKDYDGNGLDWFSFDIGRKSPRNADKQEQSRKIIPQSLYFKGMPHPRWWRFEDGDVFLDSGIDPEPNVLSTLLVEFVYADVNNWFVFPLEQQTGCLRRIKNLTAIDSFDIGTEIQPMFRQWSTNPDSFQLFNLAATEKSTVRIGGDVLFLPEVANEPLQGAICEEVDFMRDELANFTWAIENYVTDSNGQGRYRAEEAIPDAVPESDDDLADSLKGAPHYKLKSRLSARHVPYMPIRINPDSLADGDTYLRRARSVETASLAKPQYQSQVVRESWRLDEDAIPRTGITVQRLKRFARGSQGEEYFWSARRRRIGVVERSLQLQFDYLEPVSNQSDE